MDSIALFARILIIVIALMPSLIFAAGNFDGFDTCRQRFRDDPNKTVIVGDSIGVGIARALGVSCPSDRCTAIERTTIEGARSQLTNVRSSHMIVSLGTNNWGEQSQAALDQKIRTFITAAGGKKIAAWVGPSQTSKNSRVESGLSRINPWVQNAITNAGISFINIRDPRNAGLNQHHDTVAGEGYHFDSTGYQILAATALNYAGICGKPQLPPGSSATPTKSSTDSATPRSSAGALAPQTSASVLGGQQSGGQGYRGSIIGSALAQTGTRPSELPGSENPTVRTPSQYLPFLFPGNSQSVPASFPAPSQIPNAPQSQSLLKLVDGLYPIDAASSPLLTDNAFQSGNNAALNAINGIAAQPLSPSISTMSELNAEHLSPPNYAAGISPSEHLPAGVAENTFQPSSLHSFDDLSNAPLNGDGENGSASFSFLRGILNRLKTVLGTFRF